MRHLQQRYAQILSSKRKGKQLGFIPKILVGLYFVVFSLFCLIYDLFLGFIDVIGILSRKIESSSIVHMIKSNAVVKFIRNFLQRLNNCVGIEPFIFMLCFAIFPIIFYFSSLIQPTVFPCDDVTSENSPSLLMYIFLTNTRSIGGFMLISSPIMREIGAFLSQKRRNRQRNMAIKEQWEVDWEWKWKTEVENELEKESWFEAEKEVMILVEQEKEFFKQRIMEMNMDRFLDENGRVRVDSNEAEFEEGLKQLPQLKQDDEIEILIALRAEELLGEKLKMVASQKRVIRNNAFRIFQSADADDMKPALNGDIYDPRMRFITHSLTPSYSSFMDTLRSTSTLPFSLPDNHFKSPPLPTSALLGGAILTYDDDNSVKMEEMFMSGDNEDEFGFKISKYTSIPTCYHDSSLCFSAILTYDDDNSVKMEEMFMSGDNEDEFGFKISKYTSIPTCYHDSSLCFSALDLHEQWDVVSVGALCASERITINQARELLRGEQQRKELAEEKRRKLKARKNQARYNERKKRERERKRKDIERMQQKEKRKPYQGDTEAEFRESSSSSSRPSGFSEEKHVIGVEPSSISPILIPIFSSSKDHESLQEIEKDDDFNEMEEELVVEEENSSLGSSSSPASSLSASSLFQVGQDIFDHITSTISQMESLSFNSKKFNMLDAKPIPSVPSMNVCSQRSISYFNDAFGEDSFMAKVGDRHDTRIKIVAEQCRDIVTPDQLNHDQESALLGSFFPNGTSLTPQFTHSYLSKKNSSLHLPSSIQVSNQEGEEGADDTMDISAEREEKERVLSILSDSEWTFENSSSDLGSNHDILNESVLFDAQPSILGEYSNHEPSTMSVHHDSHIPFPQDHMTLASASSIPFLKFWRMIVSHLFIRYFLFNFSGRPSHPVVKLLRTMLIAIIFQSISLLLEKILLLLNPGLRIVLGYILVCLRFVLFFSIQHFFIRIVLALCGVIIGLLWGNSLIVSAILLCIFYISLANVMDLKYMKQKHKGKKDKERGLKKFAKSIWEAL
ncbi:hypothetical protein ADUPG1_010880 [Aduncisulcus paluster]|uniref:Uncharacterized protein n=1 Tax=Aduncisulcus paluster TaxID=2918883 RepID=A0ABQ5JT75_9EUKA|nr:hypothetical protein ADUPG1_010880 [Aduncisulcus paluster]